MANLNLVNTDKKLPFFNRYNIALSIMFAVMAAAATVAVSALVFATPILFTAAFAATAFVGGLALAGAGIKLGQFIKSLLNRNNSQKEESTAQIVNATELHNEQQSQKKTISTPTTQISVSTKKEARVISQLSSTKRAIADLKKGSPKDKVSASVNPLSLKIARLEKKADELSKTRRQISSQNPSISSSPLVLLAKKVRAEEAAKKQKSHTRGIRK